MNSRQNRQLRRMVDPIVLRMADGIDRLADDMQKNGTTMTPEECRIIARELREMVNSRKNHGKK